MDKESTCNAGDRGVAGSVTGLKDPQEQGRQPTPVFFLEIPGTEEPHGLQSMGPQRASRDKQEHSRGTHCVKQFKKT